MDRLCLVDMNNGESVEQVLGPGCFFLGVQRGLRQQAIHCIDVILPVFFRHITPAFISK